MFAGEFHTYLRVVGCLSAAELFADDLKSPVKFGKHMACTGWAAFVDVFKNSCQFSLRLAPEPNPHAVPKRFRRVRKSSSVANSPRLAWASPSATAARSSAVIT